MENHRVKKLEVFEVDDVLYRTAEDAGRAMLASVIPDGAVSKDGSKDVLAAILVRHRKELISVLQWVEAETATRSNIRSIERAV